MNDLSTAAANHHRHRRRRHDGSCLPFPPLSIYILITLFLLALALSLFILAVVHNPAFLLILLLFSSIVAGFLLWNSFSHTTNASLLFYLHSSPDSDLPSASDGDILKITGVVSCGSLSLESSYEKVDRCVYTSTMLYEYGELGLKPTDVNVPCFQWRLAFAERFSTDFHITDSKSGIRALVKAGVGCKVAPLVLENRLVRTRTNLETLSSYLKKWLQDRNLPTEARLLCLEEGYIKEGGYASIIGMLRKSNEGITIVQPPGLVSTGCLWRRLLVPADFDGLVLGVPKLTHNTTAHSGDPN